MANASNHEIIYSPLVNHSYFSADYEMSFRPTESDLSFIQHIVQAPNFGIKQILEVGCGSGGLGQYVSKQTKIPVISTDLCVSNKKNNMTEFSNKRLNSVIPMNSVSSVQKYSDRNTLLLSSFLLPYNTNNSDRYDAKTLQNFKGNLFINVGIYHLDKDVFTAHRGRPIINEILVLNEKQTGSISLKQELNQNWVILDAMPHGQKFIGGISSGITYVVLYARRASLQIPRLSAKETDDKITSLKLTLDKCSHCQIRGKDYKQCSHCKKVKYCCVSCQRSDWATHKKACISSKSKQSKSAQGKGTRRKSRKKFINKFIRKSKKSRKSRKSKRKFLNF